MLRCGRHLFFRGDAMSDQPFKEPARTNKRWEQEFRSAWDQRHLHLIIMPTEKCNFRCVYCYEDFKIGRMSAATKDAVKRLLENRVPGLTSLEINWFGGEPTVALDVVEDTMSAAQGLCNQHDVSLRGGMTTNGFLLTDVVYGRLVERGVVDFQISLDGPAEFHDTTRLQANGKGSFERIVHNLDMIRDGRSGGGEILLRLHLTQLNQSAMPHFADWLRRRYGGDPRFRFTIQPVEDLGGAGDLSELVLPGVERAWGENTIPAEAEDDMERVHDENYVCYAAKANSFVVRADGRVGKCTVALRSDNNTVGSLNADGTLAIDEDKIARWFVGWETRNKHALACPAAANFQ